MPWFKKKKYRYRIDTLRYGSYIDGLDLETSINAVVREKLFEGRWRLHAMHIEPRETHTKVGLPNVTRPEAFQVILVFEREV